MEPAKTPAQSEVQTRYLVMPHHSNPLGTAFGGVVMSWIDMVAAMAAKKHCCGEVVTASIDSLSFDSPIRIGDQVVLKASVNYVGKTSLEVGVKVLREDPITGETAHTTRAYLTFVALDKNLKPIPAPRLEPQTDEDKRRWQNASIRVKARKELRLQIKPH